MIKVLTGKKLQESVDVVDRIRRSPAVLELCLSKANLVNKDWVDKESIYISAEYANLDGTIEFSIKFSHDMKKTGLYDIAEYIDYATISTKELASILNKEERKLHD